MKAVLENIRAVRGAGASAGMEVDLPTADDGLGAASVAALVDTASAVAAVRTHALQLGDAVEVLRNNVCFGLTGVVIELDSFEGGALDGAIAYKLSCGGWYALDELRLVRSRPDATPLSPCT